LFGVRRGWNRTTLELSDGAKVVIDHCWFASGDEADRFREFLEEVRGARNAEPTGGGGPRNARA